jgi:hypothetical protein
METPSTKITIAVLAVKLDDIKTDVTEVKSLLTIQNGRIRKLENWRNFVAGVLFLIGILAGWIGEKVSTNLETVTRLEQIHKSEISDK